MLPLPSQMIPLALQKVSLALQKIPLALQKIEDEYLLFAAAALVSVVAFVGLILVPAVSSYGRLWEKAVAGVLSVVVLVALVLTGVVVGLAFVYYYDEIASLLG